jgi:hypothetical protein
MQRFEIYHKSKKFHLTNNIVFYSCSLVGITAFVIGKIIGLKENTLYMNATGYFGIVAFATGILARGIGFFIKPPLRGTLDGFIELNISGIKIDQKYYPLSEIKKINISNDDYYGKRINLDRSNLNSTISNGVNNELEITLASGAVEKCYFQLYYPNDLQKNKNELINYYKAEKLDFNILTNTLGIEKNEVEEFKKNI